MNRPTSPEDVQKVFDCYCKKILKNEAINIQKHYQHLNDVQVSFSELTPEQLAELATYDDYSTDYDLYKVMGYDVKIKNELLSEALRELSEEEPFILLLYGFGFNDGEIADLLKIVHRIVNYKRHRKSAVKSALFSWTWRESNPRPKAHPSGHLPSQSLF